jgi:hypothetical protein
MKRLFAGILNSLIVIFLTSVCLICTGYAAGRDITLRWDKSIDDSYLKGYKIYYYRISGQPGSLWPTDYAESCTVLTGSCSITQGPITIDKDNTQITLHVPDENKNYYFVATAVDSRDLESVPTPEISLFIVMRMTVSKAGTGKGTVTGQPLGINSADINCRSTVCSADYNFGSQVTLTATPDVDNAFTGWYGNDCSGTAPCVVTMDSPMSVTAEFRPLRKLVSLNGITGLNFGYVEPGHFKELTLTVQNIGTQLLTGTVSASPPFGPFSIISGGNYTLGDSQTQQVVVRYTAPLTEGWQTGSLIFTGGGGLTIQVRGTNTIGLPWLMLLLD